MRYISITILTLALPLWSSAQIVVAAHVVGTDTIPVFQMNEVKVVDQMGEKGRERYKAYAKLVHNVKTVMPYAQEFAARMRKIDNNLSKIENKRDRRRYLKKMEGQLKLDFEKDLKNLTYSQGHLLVKLIDRETGKSSYDLIRQYKSGFTAMFWNTFAGAFGINLRNTYDPGEEEAIERVLESLGYE